MPKAMFQVMLVKIRNIEASSSAGRPPPSTPTNTKIAAGKKPSTGTDCPTSSNGRMKRASLGRVAAR